MKTYKVKNYKGNLVESLSKFQKSHKGMKIVEAVEDGKDLKIKTEGQQSVLDEYDVPNLKEVVEPLKECFETYASWFNDAMSHPEEWDAFQADFVEALKKFAKELESGLEYADIHGEYEKLNKAIEKFEKDCHTYEDQW